MLSSPVNPILAAAVVAIAAASGFGSGYVVRGRAEVERQAKTEKAREEAVQARIDAALSTQHAEHERLLAAAEKRAEQAEKRTAKVAGLIGEIRDAPETVACASSPAVRTALNGLRQLEVDAAGSNPN